MTTLDRHVMIVPRPATLPPDAMKQRLRTVEDINQFFNSFDPPTNGGAPHPNAGKIPPFKFVYCAKVDTGNSFRPYDIVAVKRGAQPINHYVVSPEAVVHVKPGNLSDVVLIAEWIKESKQFDRLRQLRFFKQYLLKKWLIRWRQNISFQRFLQARTQVSKKLFLSKNTFANSTLELHRLSYDTRLGQSSLYQGKIPPSNTKQNNQDVAIPSSQLLKQGLFPVRLIFYPDVRPQWGYTADAFIEVQRNHMLKVQQILNRTITEACGVAQSAVERVSEQACVPELNTIEDLEQHISIGSNVKGTLGALFLRERNAERQARKRELKKSIVEYDFLQPWIRLFDAMLTTELVQNLLHSFETFAKHLEIPRQGQHRELRISFQVGVVFKDEEPLRFVPSCEDVQDLVVGFMQETVERLSAIQRVVEMKEFSMHFFRKIQPSNITQMMSQSSLYQQLKSRVTSTVFRDFGEAQEKSRIYEPCRQWLNFVNNEWPEEFSTWGARAAEKNKEKALDEAEIKRYIAKVAKARQDLGKMTNKHSGVVSINIEPLLAELSARLDGVLADIKSTLLALANRRVHEVGKELEANIQTLKHPVVELRAFCLWLEQVNQVSENSRNLLQECTEVDNLYIIAEDNGFDFPQHNKDKRDRTVGVGKGGEPPLRVQLTDAMDSAMKFKKENLDEIRTYLDTQISVTTGHLKDTTNSLKEGEYKEAGHAATSILTKLQGVNQGLEAQQKQKETYNHYCDLIEVPQPDWKEMQEATGAFEQKHDLWSTVAKWEERRSYWNRTPVSQLDGEKIKEEMVEMFQKSHKLSKANPNDTVCERLLNAITVEKINLPVMVELCNPALKQEHWLKIFDGIGKRLPPAESRNLETLRTFGAYQYVDLINQVSAVATGEYSLLNQINKIALLWDKTEFVLSKPRESENYYVLGGLDEIMQQLDDHQVQVQTCLASRFVSGIKEMVEEWDSKLQLVAEVLDEWVNVQRSWMYLEFIFSSEDIKKQLPEESRMFNTVNKMFRNLMANTVSNNNVLSICTEEEGLLERLKSSTESLDKIQKRLEDYLETKRIAFPRFYFLSNDELLSILSDVRNPMAVQPHLQKCFDNIKELDFDGPSTITAMKSQEGEVVPLASPIKIVGNVENWLTDIEAMMRRTLYEITEKAHDLYPEQKRTEWYFNFPAQVIGCVDQIIWTREVEHVWDQMTNEGKGPEVLSDYIEGYKRQILDTVELVKGQLTTLQRTCVITLLVIDVHSRDVLTFLLDQKCSSVSDFNWERQLRYYWETKDDDAKPDCHIRHSAAHITYGYEYLGNQQRLVITPLTERAFLTCTSALHMHQGGAPQGPAGTGKTESVKDLGKALARQVVVFNCSDGINYKMMSQMFAGLAQAGAWACFDEFNRIELEVLSVIAQQMLEITTAIAARQTSMRFDGRNIRLHKNFGVFITMNPGYAGRTELPDNLKALFRPICMMIPDYALIAEIMFFSEGFSDAKPLAQKMVRLYSLASQQLSKQDHYDFGMRAVKSILVMAGALKRAEPDQNEDMILIRAMRDSNVPKFLREDTTLFLALIRDLFPSVNIREVVNEELEKELKDTLVRNGQQPVRTYLDKIMQLYETMVVRHGVMLVGQTLTGKTTNARTLQESLTSLHSRGVEAQHEAHEKFFAPAAIHTLNPKSISMGEMYGDIDKITREWQDGVLSNIVRDLVRRAGPDRHWINFDGPVDAIWIENMNTVLDDNKLLCLVNGERIKLPATLSIVFEVQDLKVASPATVSRCGMVFMEPFYLDGGWKPLAQSYSERVAKSEGGLNGKWRHERLQELLTKTVPQTLDFYRSHCHEYIATVNEQLVINLLTFLYALVKAYAQPEENDLLSGKGMSAAKDGENGAGKSNDDPDFVEGSHKRLPAVAASDDRKLFDLYFQMAFIYGIGGNISDRARAKFSAFAHKLFGSVFSLAQLSLEEGQTYFDFFVHRGSMSWASWSCKVPEFTYDPQLAYFDMLVPTTDTCALKQLLSTAASVQKHCLVNGITGVGKSVAVGNFLAGTLRTEDADSKFVSFSITFSAQTSSQNFQETMESKMSKRRGDKEVGPPVGKKLVVVVDDCNMPQLEKYGASPPIELLRQVITQKGCYDRKKLTFREYSDVMFIACCGEPGGGKNELTKRLTSQFFKICVPAVGRTSMHTIFRGLLHGFLESASFNKNLVEMTDNIVSATLDVYERITAEMLPTPEKTHYTFNLRDVSKVIQGILELRSQYTTSAPALIGGWVHESSRVFHDRLINEVDREWWWKCIESTIKERMSNESSGFDASKAPTALFGAWADKKVTEYKEITDKTMMHEMLREYQLDYNATMMKDVDLVLFEDAISHLSRICRILRQPRGNALLVGVGGSGRHSLCELAAYISQMDCRSIVIVRNYGVNEFHEDIKSLLLACGCQDKKIAFLISDTQIIYNQFLEDINNLLNIGEVPGLMGSEEYDKIMQACREPVRALGKPETRATFYQFFVNRCRENLHVIMCMSPVGSQFRDRLRMFPSLVNCMTIDWYTAWPAEALLSVATRNLAKMNMESDAVKKAVCTLCVHMHVTVKDKSDDMFSTLRRRNDTTPTSYLSLLSLYDEVYMEQDDLISKNMKRYKSGLDKLNSTNSTIEELKEKIRQMQPVLAQAAKDADQQKEQLKVEEAEADVVKQEVEAEEKTAREFMDEAESIRAECQAGLDEALPALDAAKAALKTLRKSDIDEIKKFTAPPTNVEKTLDAICILLREKEGWASAKLQLGKMDFLTRLQDYAIDEIPPIVIRKLGKFMQDDEFTPEIVEKTNQACKSLCMWAHAMYKYYHVSKEIAPKREKLAEADAKVAKAKSELAIKQARLQTVVNKINELQRQSKETADRKANLESQITEAEAKLGRADQLIGGLASEKVRWQQSLETLREQKKNLVGTMLLAAGCVAYVGPFPSQYRTDLVKDWTDKCKELKIPVAEGFSLDTLPDQVTVRNWLINSLPADPFSIENATILQRSKRWCLMVDPQGQANQFIRKKEANNKLKVLKLTDDNYMRTIESSIQVGHPVLIENVGEELDAALNPVLLKQYVKQGGRLVLKLGEKDIDYDPSFRLYITTKLPNPRFTPELQIKVTVVNFTVTRKGLEDQQLSDVVQFERRELQEKSDQCVVAIAEGKDKIQDLESTILKMLAESSGEILDNVELIDTLSASKKTSDEVSRDLEVVEKTNEEIEAAREKYRRLATRGSLIYGVIADLSNVDPMYQNSLQFFKKLFVNTLDKTPAIEGETVEERVSNLIPAVTWSAYSTICRGLFEKDKLLFSFFLTISIIRFEGAIEADEWSFFLRGSAGKDPSATFSPCPTFVRKKAWADFAVLTEKEPFTFFEMDLVKHSTAEWEKWITHDEVHAQPVPSVVSGTQGFTEWHRLLLVKTFRPEKLIFATARFVEHYLGKQYTESPQFNLGEAFADSSKTTPLIFVLSTGTDPTLLFTTFAEEQGFKEKKLMLSLGQDQGKRAQQMIEEARKEGMWVYLQNCHVYVSWMPQLEKILEQARPEDTHEDFRLWLTSNPSKDFPVPILQTSLKLTREPPKGLKSNLKDSVHSLDPSVWGEYDSTPREGQWKKLLFALSFFHAVVQERRKFGALGWNVAYEWSNPDLAASIKTIRIALGPTANPAHDASEPASPVSPTDDHTDVSLPWTALQYTIGVINYGGRVTDFLDNRCLQTIVKRFFEPSLTESETTTYFDKEQTYHGAEPTWTKDELASYVDSLPQWEKPELFGLNANANITFQAKESSAMMNALISMQPRGGGGGGSSVDEVVMNVAVNLLEKLPERVDRSKADPSSFAVNEETGTMISLGTVLSQEIDQFNTLVSVISKSLKELIRAIKGEVVMSSVMEAMHESLLFNLVPQNWKDKGYLCLKPLASYYTDLQDRISFISDWCYRGAPKSFWVPGLFFPQGFITGVFQTESRLHGVPIDTLKMGFSVLNEREPGPDSETVDAGVLVHGFFIEGAVWDGERRCIKESPPNVLQQPLPVIHFKPVPINTPQRENVYECPLYKASTRAGALSTTGLSTNFILNMELEAGEHGAAHWINRGVASLCMLDD